MTSATLRSPAKIRKFLLDVLPEQGCWSDELYLSFTDSTNKLIELTDGFLEVLPTPTHSHQSILKFLFRMFDGYLEPRGGVVQFATLRLRIREGKFREPDLLMMLSAADARLQDRFWLGADVVLEVVSPDDPRRDLVEKRRDYAEGRVPEYWIVNPLTEKITVLVLNGKRYRRFGVFGRGENARSSLLKGFEVGVAEVFDTR